MNVGFNVTTTARPPRDDGHFLIFATLHAHGNNIFSQIKKKKTF